MEMMTYMYIMSIWLNIMVLAMYLDTNGFVFRYVHVRPIGYLAGVASLLIPFYTIYWLNAVEIRISKTTDFNVAKELYDVLHKGGTWVTEYGHKFICYNDSFLTTETDTKLLGASSKVLRYLMDVHQRHIENNKEVGNDTDRLYFG